ncbi:hypothetical protein CVIRNUC_003240 [Coccomyxa viridis]|uniref:Uncharacterized protein n=1 Tax=Coccomyxa viridis TaxID=1274662 RepID=A0AAV1I1R4_9CHLO|nr:hypothetical protein CVIRNUC_003240 [Coccomyxa viridis]
MVMRAVILALAFSCVREISADTANITGGSSNKPFRLLFVGNSIFFTNGGVNHVVARLLQEQFPQETIQATEIAEPNFLLRQHLEKAWIPGTKQFEALSTNSSAQWDVVIFQEETQQMAMGGEDAAGSLQALKDLSWLARTHGAKVSLTYPSTPQTLSCLANSKLE